MDYALIFSLIQKGITVVSALIQAGQEAAPALKALTDLTTGAQSGTVTDDQLAQAEALLDQMIEDFNVDMPPAATA